MSNRTNRIIRRHPRWGDECDGNGDAGAVVEAIPGDFNRHREGEEGDGASTHRFRREGAI